MSNLDNSQKSQFRNFKKILIWKIPKISNSEIPKMSDLENFKNVRFVKFQKFPIWKLPKSRNMEAFMNF